MWAMNIQVENNNLMIQISLCASWLSPAPLFTKRWENQNWIVINLPYATEHRQYPLLKQQLSSTVHIYAELDNLKIQEM